MAAKLRVRRTGGLVILGALVLLVLGRGLGLWTGGSGAPGGAGEGDASAAGAGADAGAERTKRTKAAADGASTAEPAQRALEPTAPPLANGTQADEPEPLPQPSESARDAPPAAADGAPVAGTAQPAAADTPVPFDDRRSARCALVRSALADGRFGDALATLDRLERDATGIAEVRELRAAAGRRLAFACDELVQRLQAGEVQDARRLLRGLLTPRHATAVAAVAALCAQHDWPSLAAEQDERSAVPALETEPPPAPVLRGRVVRLPDDHGGGARARVVAESAAGVTVRAVGNDGVTFPILPAWLLQPDDVTPAEAAELGLAALAAGERASAALWCACGLVRATAVPERLQRLRELLP